MGSQSRIVTGTRRTEHYDASGFLHYSATFLLHYDDTARISPKTGRGGWPGWSVSIMLYYGRRPLLPLFSPANWSEPAVQKELPKSARLTMVASKITSFTSPSPLIGLPLRDVQNTRNSPGRKIFRWKPIETGEGLELANLVKIPRLSSDENQRIRVGELRRKLSSGGRAHRSRAIEELSRKKYNLQLGRNIICSLEEISFAVGRNIICSWKFIICSWKKYDLQIKRNIICSWKKYDLQFGRNIICSWKKYHLQLEEISFVVWNNCDL